MALDDATWAEIRRLYVETQEPVHAICAGYGIHSHTLYARARQENWPRRYKRVFSAIHGDGGEDADAGAPARVLVGSLYKTISLKLKRMEKRMTRRRAGSAQDEERESREMATMIKNLEKITEVAAEIERAQHSGERRGAASPAHDADRMRREIVERLERLAAQRNARRTPGNSD
jgi:hypothetical protein